MKIKLCFQLAALMAVLCFAEAGRSQSNLPPAIISQPQKATVTNVTTVTFTVDASGTGPLAYQWLFNGQPVTNNIISTIAGNGAISGAALSGDGEGATNANLDGPNGVSADDDGNVFIVDQYHNRVLKVNASGIITTLAGNGTSGYSGNGSVATNSELSYPFGVAVDGDGNVFIADTQNQRVRAETYGFLVTVAGSGQEGNSGVGGSALNASLNEPHGVAVDAEGNIYFADSINNRICKVDLNDNLTTVAGTGQHTTLGDGGPATNADLDVPYGVAIDAFGDLLIADTVDNRIRKVATNGIISTVAGNGNESFGGDGGAATNAPLNNPAGVCVDAYGNILIADTGNNRIRKVSVNGLITTVAGGGPQQSGVGDGLAATNAILDRPYGVAIDASGNLLIADTLDNRIRKVTTLGASYALANANVANAGNYQVIVSSPYGSTTSSVAVLTVDLPPSISQQPANLTIVNGSNATFSASVTASYPFYYQWQFDGTNLTPGYTLLEGPVAGVGLNLNSVSTNNAGSYDVIVTNTFGSVTSSIVALNVVFPPAITNQPVTQVMVAGSNAIFTVGATGTAPLSYQWQCDGTNLMDGGDTSGSATTNLVLAAVTANSAGLYDVIVSNAWGSVTSSVASLTIAYPPGIASQPTDEIVVSGTHTNLSVAATGTMPLSYQWQFNGTNLTDGGYVSGSATTNLNLALVTTNNAGLYDVIIANAWGSVTSRLASMTVVLPPAIVAQPASTNVLLGENAGFAVVASGTAPLFYQWQFNGANLADGEQISGSATSALLVTQITTNNVGSYDVIITNAWGSVTSVVVTLSIAIPPAITVQPVSVTYLSGNLGNNDSFAVTATGTAPLAYQWQFNGTNLPDAGNPQDANSSRLFFDPVRTNNAGLYDVVVTNFWGSVTSSVVPLTILYPPTITNQPVSQVVTNAKTVTFTVGATGLGQLTYQWLFNGHIITNNIITTVAGIGNQQGNVIGDGGPATNAGLSLPFGVALDGGGNLLIADTDNNRIQKVNTNGIITTIAGNGDSGYNGNGNVATNSWLDRPYSVAVDPYDDIFIADRFNSRIREVAYDIMITLAGTGNGGYSGDGGAAYDAELNEPSGVAVDASGNIYIADTENSRIRKVDVNDNITTIAGKALSGFAGDGGPATNASLAYPAAITVDAYGNLFIADTANMRVRKVDTNGIITTVAGKGSEGYSGDNGLATNAFLNTPSGLAVDGYGNLYIADTGNNRIRKVNPSGTITTVAGSGTLGFSGDGGAATNAWLYAPAGVAVDAHGDLFIADTDNQRIREVTPQGPSLTVANLTATNAGNYQVIVSNAGGSVTSSVATLTIDVPPAITQQPVSQSVISGGTANFSVTDTGAASLAYQWQFNGTNLPEATEPNFGKENVSPANAGPYQVVITNLYGSVTSSVATLTVSLPQISVANGTNGGVTLNLMTAPNISSRVQMATNLGPPIVWQTIHIYLGGTNAVWQYIDTNNNEYPIRFYRTSTP